MKSDRQRDDEMTNETAAPLVIPAVKIGGSRAERLQTLDALIRRLQQMRRGIAGDVGEGAGSFEGPSVNATEPSWPWFAAGAVLGGIFVVVLLLAARGCAGV